VNYLINKVSNDYLNATPLEPIIQPVNYWEQVGMDTNDFDVPTEEEVMGRHDYDVGFNKTAFNFNET
jgi:hypothetical protein